MVGEYLYRNVTGTEVVESKESERIEIRWRQRERGHLVKLAASLPQERNQSRLEGMEGRVKTKEFAFA